MRGPSARDRYDVLRTLTCDAFMRGDMPAYYEAVQALTRLVRAERPSTDRNDDRRYRPLSPEHRAKLSAARQAYIAGRRSPRNNNK